ncbi:MAG: hypothetical protein QF535_14610, partial [Anaerolineales bacterium]|nr:hypothetical protein [Anaerolineales bacterium]
MASGTDGAMLTYDADGNPVAITGTDGQVATSAGAGAVSAFEAAGVSGVTSDGTDITITSGDIIFGAAGKGINLGVTSNTDSNTLDDYEEGTWTPQYQCNLGTGGDSNSGTYIKIGKLVYFEGYLTLLNTDWSAGGTLLLIGIPFVATSNTAKLVCDTDQWGNYHPQKGRINSTYIQLQYFIGNTDGYDFVRGSDTADGGDHNQMWFAGSYRST